MRKRPLDLPSFAQKVVTREVEPERLGWINSGHGWWTHRVTGQRYIFAPGVRQVFLIPPWMDDKDLNKLAESGGMIE